MYKVVGIYKKYGKYIDDLEMGSAGTSVISSGLPNPPKGYAKLIVKAANLTDSNVITVTVKYRFSYGSIGKTNWKTLDVTFTSNGSLQEYDLYTQSDWGQGLFDEIEFQFNFSASKKMKITGKYYYE